MISKPGFAVRVVGCKVNQVEARMLAAQLEDAGWCQCRNGDAPDLVLVHTCTVTQRADRDSKRYITQSKKQFPQAAIAVSGCLAELEPQNLISLPGVIAVISQKQRAQTAQIIQQILMPTRSANCPAGHRKTAFQDRGFFQPDIAVSMPGRSRAMIKIEDGCDGECTYCRVRLARGKPVSRPLAEIKKEACSLIRKGFQEIVITGVNIGCWQPGLAQLIFALAQLPGQYRLRLSSVEPQHLTADLIRALARAGDKICPHLHLPVQSGDDTILKAMRRTYTVQQLKQRIKNLRQAIPQVVLTGDVIAGFPGETMKAFENSCQLVRECPMIRLHVFPFSARPGTGAAGMPGHLISREITSRAKELRDLGKSLAKEYCQSRLGTMTTVLLEQKVGHHLWTGTTETYNRARIVTIGKAGWLVTGKISGLQGETLLVNQ